MKQLDDHAAVHRHLPGQPYHAVPMRRRVTTSAELPSATHYFLLWWPHARRVHLIACTAAQGITLLRRAKSRYPTYKARVRTGKPLLSPRKTYRLTSAHDLNLHQDRV